MKPLTVSKNGCKKTEIELAGKFRRIAEITRGAEAPPEVVACSIFIIDCGLFVFVNRPGYKGLACATLPIGR